MLEIRIKGCLETHWTEWFAGFQVHPTGQNETTLTGPIQDPSALYGLLSRLRDLGMELISVNPVEHSLETAQQSD